MEILLIIYLIAVTVIPLAAIVVAGMIVTSIAELILQKK